MHFVKIYFPSSKTFVKAMLDSGATDSFIDNKTQESLKLVASIGPDKTILMANEVPQKPMSY